METTIQTKARLPRVSERVPGNFFGSILDSGAMCALLDKSYVVTKASAAFEAEFPRATGKPIVECIDCSLLGAPPSPDTAVTTFGTFRRGNGESVPALVQLFPMSAETLVIVTDATAFRDAEARRFETTPYTILRLASDGRVTYANQAAYQALSRTPENLLGQPFASVFEPEYKQRIRTRLAFCVSHCVAQSLYVFTRSSGRSGGQTADLTLTPDIGPDGRPLGAVAVIQSTIQTAREAIRKIALDPEVKRWQTRLELVLQEIRKVIDYDHANFGIYADGMSLFRVIAAYPDGSIPWPARWLELPRFVPKWVAKRKPWIDDMEKFVARDPAMARGEVVRAYRDFGIRSSVTLIVDGAAGGPTSALTLCSRELKKYGQRDSDILNDLALLPVLIRCEEQRNVERQAFIASLKSMLEDERPLRKAAQDIVDQIAQYFDWDYAGLFRVNRSRQQFELVHQKVSNRKYAMDENYTQEIDKGMLAATLDANGVRVVHDIGAPGVEQYGYVGSSRTLRSAMTIPIHLNDRVRWVLNVESAVSNTFRGPDEAALEAVVKGVEEGLTQRMLRELKACLMKETDRGVVLVGTEGSVFETNDTADRLLGRADAAILAEGKRMSDYAGDNPTREVLEGLTLTSKRRITLKGDDGKTRTVIATRMDLDSSFDTALWFLTDIEDIKWIHDVRFLRDTVSEVAKQIRAPLALAALHACELTQMDGDLARETCKRLLAEIGKADLTFERLAEAASIQRAPMPVEELVDLRRCITEVVDMLPEHDKTSIRAKLPKTGVCVMGNNDRLSFVIRSIIAYLLRVRSIDSMPLLVSLKEGAARVTLKLKLKTGKRSGTSADNVETDEADVLLQVTREAREAVSLSLPDIQLILSKHNVELVTTSDDRPADDGSPMLIAFELQFPRVPGA